MPMMDDAPCDFTRFVAERRGVDRGAAERLIARWLESYEPRTKPLRR